MSIIKLSIVDQLITTLDNGLRALFATPIAQRENPAQSVSDKPLSEHERKKSGALMRINHTGEVCAQALYYGQSLFARSAQTKTALLNSANEETDHLAWCANRIHELASHTSYLNPLWYMGSFGIGMVAGMINDSLSLGFVVETERQVGEHLKNHLEILPENDAKSRLILEKMSEDEAYHATVAMSEGAVELPDVVKKIMRLMSKIMTRVTYYI